MRFLRTLLLLAFPAFALFQYFDYIVNPRPIQPSKAETELAQNVKLKDITAAAGISHWSEPADLPKELAKLPVLSKMAGFGVAVADFDNDGWMDFYATSAKAGSLNHLYRNNHNGTFTEVAKQFGVASINDDTFSSNAALWLDFDADGWSDLFVTGTGCPKLFHNENGRSFREIPFGPNGDKSFCGDSQGAVALDFNGDSLLDIYVVNRCPKDWRHVKGDTKVFLPSRGDAETDTRNQLFQNLGNGKFTEVPDAGGAANKRWSFAAVAADLNNDGWPDLFVANDSAKDKIYLNQHGRFIAQDSRKVLPGLIGRGGMNAETVDLDGSGNLDIFVSKASSHPRFAMRRNEFWHFNPAAHRYENRAQDLGIDSCGWAWGAVFLDTQLRGEYDLLVVNGLDSGTLAQKGPWNRNAYLFTMGSAETVSSAFLEDVKFWPPMKGRGVAGTQGNCFFYNTGKSFVNIAPSLGWRPQYDGRAVALIDFDNNGTQDVLISNAGGPLQLLKNERISRNNWVGFRVVDPHTKRAIAGARVTLLYKDEIGKSKQRIQDIRYGNGFAAQSDSRLVFGLGRGEPLAVSVRLPGKDAFTVRKFKTNAYNTIFANNR